MEYNLLKTSVGSLVTHLDTVMEQPVDLDFTLPDYCPDIERILRCKITPKIYNRNFSGGQITVDGATLVTVLYIDSQNNNLRACEQSIPFNATFQVKDALQFAVIDTNTKVEYINCRALSQRRLTVHGAFSLYVKAMSIGSTDLYSPNDNENLECNSKDVEVSVLSALSQCQFAAGDDITITNKPPVEVILTSDVKANITDYKVIAEKIMLNGELSVKLLYLSNTQEGQIQQIDCIIPFSQVVECENLTEDATTCLMLKVMSYEIRLKSEMLSENPIVSVDTKLCATIFGYNQKTVSVIFDAYSTEYATDIVCAPVNIMSNTNVIKDTFMEKESINFDDINISSICDITSEFCTITPMITDNGISLNIKVNLCVLVLDDNNVPVYVERVLEFNKDIDSACDFNNILNSTGSIVSISYRISDNNTLELRVEICYTITTSVTETINTVISAKSDEEKKITKLPCALTLYYGKAGERLWDIAKEYKTKCHLLYEENNLNCDTLEDSQMLLIPMV